MNFNVKNPSYGKNFVRSTRRAARSRGGIQGHPDHLEIAMAVLENGGHDIKLWTPQPYNGIEEWFDVGKELIVVN